VIQRITPNQIRAIPIIKQDEEIIKLEEEVEEILHPSPPKKE
jgi:hypothetical protein